MYHLIYSNLQLRSPPFYFASWSISADNVITIALKPEETAALEIWNKHSQNERQNIPECSNVLDPHFEIAHVGPDLVVQRFIILIFGRRPEFKRGQSLDPLPPEIVHAVHREKVHHCKQNHRVLKQIDRQGWPVLKFTLARSLEPLNVFLVGNGPRCPQQTESHCKQFWNGFAFDINAYFGIEQVPLVQYLQVVKEVHQRQPYYWQLI